MADNNTVKKRNNPILLNLLLIAIVVVLTVIPLIFIKDAEFSGADSQAEVVITEINKNYKPWFSSIWEPPSGEVESLLFCLQAAIGGGVLGYIMGYLRARKKFFIASGK